MNNIYLQLALIRRKVRKIKQYELAERIGISQPYLSALENGRKNPHLDLVERWAAELDAMLVLTWEV